MSENTLIVGFDGMDKELVEEFNLETIYQAAESFGSIDNESDVNKKKTVELFSSMITGKTIDELSREGMKKSSSPIREQYLDLIIPKNLRKNTRGAVRIYNTLETALDIKTNPYTAEDFEIDTVFERVDNSRAMFIPGYNPSKFWVAGPNREIMQFDNYDKDDAIELWKSREHSYRKKTLLRELENDIVSPRDFLMCHFHVPDFFQHLYGDKELQNYDEEFLRKLYSELDDLAGEIKEKALENGYQKVVFMSDHGLPTTLAHNENAFYSSNKDISVDGEVKIKNLIEEVRK